MALQIFPMSDEYLRPGQTIVQFFMTDLLVSSSHRPVPGRFNFRKSGVTSPRGTLLLFQYGGEIRAHAELIGRGQPDSVSPPDSNGYLLLAPRSVRFYARPVTLPELQVLWQMELGRLSHLDQRKRILSDGARQPYLNLVANR